MNGPDTQNIRDIHIIGKNTKEWIVRYHTRSSGISINLAGMSHAKYGFHFRRTNPDHLQILACLDGRGMVRVNGEFEPCCPGQAYITPPWKLHEYKAVKSCTWKVVWVGLVSSDESRYPAQPIKINIDSQALREIISGMYREFISNCDPVIMNNWQAILQRQCSRLLGGEDIDIRLRKLWHNVDANLQKKWTLDDMADLAQMSEEHLRRLCVNQYGLSPMRMLTKMRMQRASVLLRVTNLKIEHIAAQVGYQNPLAFSTAFRRNFNMPPKAYRNK